MAEAGRRATRLVPWITLSVLRDGNEPVHRASLDLVMADLGEPETWSQLSRLRPELRVLFATGYADDATASACRPTRSYEKPLRMEELLSRIRAK
jgi:hypothetical protein